MGLFQKISSLWSSSESQEEKVEDAVTEEGAQAGVGRPGMWLPTDFEADSEKPPH